MDLYSHPDWQGFVGWIRSEPLDDSPRLIACDWLAEHGDEVRSDFIRLQIEAHRQGGTEQGLKLAKRAKWILSRNRKQWWTFGPKVEWERGFVEKCSIGDRGWAYYHKELLAKHPLTEIAFDFPPTLYAILENNRRLIPTFEKQNLAFCWPCQDLIAELFARQYPGIIVRTGEVVNFFSRQFQPGERRVYSLDRRVSNLRVERSSEEEGIFILPTLPPPVPKK